MVNKTVYPKQVMQKLVELCKRTGFLFPSAEIHGGLRGSYDYGSLGVELKRNVSSLWWRNMCYERPERMVGIDTSILTPKPVLSASGHVDNFCDELVDCLVTNHRFRPDKADPVIISKFQKNQCIRIKAPDNEIAIKWANIINEQFLNGVDYCLNGNEVILYIKKVENLEDGGIGKKIKFKTKGKIDDTVDFIYPGYACPITNSIFLTKPRKFNLMFKTFLDPIDPIDKVINDTLALSNSIQLKDEELNSSANHLSFDQLKDQVLSNIDSSTVFLRPETAQGVFVNYLYSLRHSGSKLPFGVCQIGKAFRNELAVEHMIFRTPEFEQMEMEFYCPPNESEHWFKHWSQVRYQWWNNLVNHPQNFKVVSHGPGELAHYAKACNDIEFLFPWGWGELEGIANRTDYDLTCHMNKTGRSLGYNKDNLKSNKEIKLNVVEKTLSDNDDDEFTVPFVIESSAGLNRACLAFLLDAFYIDPKTNRTILKLHPSIAPIKVGILPLINHPQLNYLAKQLSLQFQQNSINIQLNDQSLKVGKRYYRMDEIGIPYCVTVDFQTLEDMTVTIRHRDDGSQERVKIDEVVILIQKWLNPFHKFNLGELPSIEAIQDIQI